MGRPSAKEGTEEELMWLGRPTDWKGAVEEPWWMGLPTGSEEAEEEQPETPSILAFRIQFSCID